MSLPCKSERSRLSHEEFELVRVTHHPAIYKLSPDRLHELKLHLRELRNKERALARQKQREMRGKAEPRGKSFPGTADQPLQRKQIFVAALKRINRELDRLRKLVSRAADGRSLFGPRVLALTGLAAVVHVRPATPSTLGPLCLLCC
jgi:hypothetical protein